MTNEDIFRGLGVEITLKEKDDFLKVRETLTRIGISSRKENKLFQSCHILQKRGRYAIMHFKELFSLDGLDTDISQNDVARRNTIASLLEEWGLLEIVDEETDAEIAKQLEEMIDNFETSSSHRWCRT